MPNDARPTKMILEELPVYPEPRPSAPGAYTELVGRLGVAPPLHATNAEATSEWLQKNWELRNEAASAITALIAELDHEQKKAKFVKTLDDAKIEQLDHLLRRAEVERDRMREALEGFLTFSSEDYDRKSDRAAAIVALKKKARAALATEKERG
jgi:hypothetical protein